MRLGGQADLVKICDAAEFRQGYDKNIWKDDISGNAISERMVNIIMKLCYFLSASGRLKFLILS